MKRTALFLLIPFFSWAQNTIGLPNVINYNKQSYNAGLQNWNIKQDKNGIVYFANNEGLLSFDGTYWNSFPLPNKTIVRSVAISADNKIYVGGQDEIGYFAPTANGRLKYFSLIDLIPSKDRLFGDVWNIVSFHNDIFIRTTNKIFKLSNKTIVTFQATTEWTFLAVANNKLLAHDIISGLLIFQENIWKPVADRNLFPANDPVTSILGIQSDSIIITTLKSGLFLYTANSITKMNLANDILIANDHIYAATLLNDHRLALATTNNGVYIIDLKGNIRQHFSKNEGLQNNNVLSIFLDKQNNLWLGLDNGIDFIAYNSAIKHISPNNQNGSGYTASIFENNLYAGTSNGLFSVPLQAEMDLSFSKGSFSLVQNTKGQTWTLATINKQLLLGHHEGAFIIKNNIALPILKEKGFWNFIPVDGVFPTSQIIGGNYNGIFYIDYINNSFKLGEKIPKFLESSRFVAIDENKNIWVSHPYHGIFKITNSVNNSFQINEYTDKNGLPSTLNNYIFKIKNQVVAATIKGVYIFNQQQNRFEPSALYKEIFGDQSIRYLKEDAAGNIWFIHGKKLGVVDYSEKNPSLIYINEVDDKILSGFEFIYPLNNQNIFLGSESGFFHINYTKYKTLKPELNVNIRNVTITNTKDSLLFGGYFGNINEAQEQSKEMTPSISYRWKTIRIGYSSTLFGYQSNLEYSYQLEGFDDNWSEWTKRTEKEYTNLGAGEYVFKVKVRNNLGNESAISQYSFKILPPWYQTKIAFLIFLVLLFFLIFYLYRRQKIKFKLQQKKHDEKQKRLLYILELEKTKAESELINFKTEKLESEINFKNSELASSAMHLVKKGELLSKIKSDLSHLIKEIENTNAKSEVKKIIKSLLEDDNMDQEWDSFSKHFDKVHSDFLAVIKEKHPDITPNEHKLCAYLRMNLSSKEIAQLMNISVRGVEISRYRLRKKLKITSDINLYDHLINISNEDYTSDQDD